MGKRNKKKKKIKQKPGQENQTKTTDKKLSGPESNKNSIILQSLQKQKCVLFLGQNYLGKPDLNPLFVSVNTKYHCSSLYEWWLENNQDLGERASQILEIDKITSINESFRKFLCFSWSTVITSAIDGIIRRILDIPSKRSVNSILSANYNQIDNVSDLPLFRLFGSIERSGSELPPANRSELLRRRKITNEMLLPINEITTPNGCLFIEGWDPEIDWVRPGDLSSSLVNFEKNQVLIFGIDNNGQAKLNKDPDFSELIQMGIIQIFEETLVDIFSRQTIEYEDIRYTPDTISYTVIKRWKHHGACETESDMDHTVFSKLEWRKLTELMEIPVSLNLREDLPDSEEGRYEAFRDFLSNGVNKSNRKWIKEFAFVRNEFKKTLNTCKKLCEKPSPQDHLVLLYGQSGSGKTIALNYLAVELRYLGLPVVLVERSIPPINPGNIETICQRISNISHVPLFLLYDGLQDEQFYFDLTSHFASRAQKCVIIGTAYPFHQQKKKKSKFVHEISFPKNINPEESDQILKHFSRFIPEADKDLKPLIEHCSDNFFAVIHRLLPPLRRRIEYSLINEITEGSQRIQELIEKFSAKDKSYYDTLPLMEQKLRAALGDKLNELFTQKIEIKNSEGKEYFVTDSLKLINAVMLSSQANLEMPQSIALRLIKNTIPIYRGTMSGNIIIEDENDNGTCILKARSFLEAEIWLRYRMPNRTDQLKLIKEIAHTIRAYEIGNNSLELEFFVKLLQAYGPQGRQNLRMTQQFRELSELIEELSCLFKEINPRLLFIQANAIRESYLIPQSGDEELELREKNLKKGEKALIKAFDIVKSSAQRLRPSTRRMLSRIEAERASVLGVIIGGISRKIYPSSVDHRYWIAKADQILEEARKAWRSSLQYDENNHMAPDIACWILQTRYRMNKMSYEQKIELFVDWNEAIDLYKSLDVPQSAIENRDRREYEFSEAAGKTHQLNAVIERLAQSGSYAAQILKARSIQENEGEHVAREYIEKSCKDKIYQDRRLLVYYMYLWWKTETGYDTFFPYERICLEFKSIQWDQLCQITTHRLSFDGEQDNGLVLFLQACALIHLGQVEAAKKTLNHLDRLGVGGYRRSKALILLTDDRGNPRQLKAEYQGRRRGGVFLAWCDELRTNIDFQPQEFNLPSLNPGTNIGPFHISIRYRGLFAEPVYRLEQTRKTMERFNAG